MKYSEYRAVANTFDILLFEDKNWLWRNVIGHVGMVIADSNDYNQIMCWESTNNGLGGQSGVQINCLSARLKAYNGVIKVRRFFYDGCEYYLSRTLLSEFIQAERSKPYPPLKERIGRWYVINAGIDLPFGIFKSTLNDKWRFCSDLLSATYNWCKLCNLGDTPSCELTPQDFHSGNQFERMLNLCCLSQEIELEKD